MLPDPPARSPQASPCTAGSPGPLQPPGHLLPGRGVGAGPSFLPAPGEPAQEFVKQVRSVPKGSVDHTAPGSEHDQARILVRTETSLAQSACGGFDPEAARQGQATTF